MNRQFTLASLAAAALVLLLGWYAVQWFLSLPGKADHDAYLLPETTVRLVTQPSRAQDYISSLAPQATKYINAIPKFSSTQGRPFRVDWIHMLPHEITFLFSRVQVGSLDVLLYVNEIPEADSFSKEVNDSGALNHLRGIYWNAPRLSAEGLTERTARGTMPIPAYVSESLTAAFPVPTAPQPPAIEGSHLFEFAADNVDGGLLEWHGAMRAAWGDWGGSAMHNALESVWPVVEYVRLTADLAEADRLECTLTVDAANAAASDAIETAARAFVDGVGLWFSEVAQTRVRTHGVEHSGLRLTLQFEASGFEARIRRALGS
ncbi:MAG: hypothetical protein GC168_05465 [Candidatus Hydrogenedens sp.]|nr:hypothetical protein [Candidatus Hydrogenedens sp.]